MAHLGSRLPGREEIRNGISVIMDKFIRVFITFRTPI